MSDDILKIWPYNLAYKIYNYPGQNVYNPIDMVHRTYGPALEDALYTLTDRERKVLRYRFVDGMTLRETGDQLGVTQERIRQIEAKALRKLRHPSRSRTYVFETNMDKLRKLEKAYSRIIKENNELRTRLDIQLRKDVEPTPLRETGLSVRAYSCLGRAGIEYVEDLEGWTIERLMKVRNLGRKTLNEVVSKAKDYGITIKTEDQA